MPYLPHIRVTTHFDLGATSAPKETASCTLAFTPFTANGTDANKLSIVNDMHDDWTTWVTSADAQVPNSVKLTQCVLYEVGADGHITSDPVRSTGDSVSGAYNSGTHPWQCSVVLTLVAQNRGKGRFGRIFLPPQVYPITVNGLIDDARHASMFTAAKLLLTSLSNKPGADVGFGVRIAGRTGSGTLRQIAEVRMGKVADTQRRRRRNLDEAYATSPFSA